MKNKIKNNVLAAEIMEPKDMFCPICNRRWLEAVPDKTGEFKFSQLLRHSCACDYERREIFNQMQPVIHRQDCILANRKYGFFDSSYNQHTFSADDGRNPEITQKCLAYVDNWETMLAKNMGAIFYGPSGTGKTFYASGIANAILDSKVDNFMRRGEMMPCNQVIVATLPMLVSKLSSSTFLKRDSLANDISMSDLLVIDDLGAERQTEYMQKEVFSIINARALSRKPLIVTTSLTPDELKEPKCDIHGKIYGLVLEMCANFPVLVPGESRRIEIAAKKREEFNKILSLND